MEVHFHGRRWPPINGMPFATGIKFATVVHVGTILVFVQPTWVGYSDGERPRVLMSCCCVSDVKCESVVLFCLLCLSHSRRPESMFH